MLDRTLFTGSIYSYSFSWVGCLVVRPWVISDFPQGTVLEHVFEGGYLWRRISRVYGREVKGWEHRPGYTKGLSVLELSTYSAGLFIYSNYQGEVPLEMPAYLGALLPHNIGGRTNYEERKKKHNALDWEIV